MGKKLKIMLSDERVRMLRHDRECGGMTYDELADKYGCSKESARDIAAYRTRASAGAAQCESGKCPLAAETQRRADIIRINERLREQCLKLSGKSI